MPDLKNSYDHVIVGGGVAADKAARAVHEKAPDATIAILSADADGPVYRPALTKDLWHGDDPDPASQDLNTAEETGADLHTGTPVTAIDTTAHSVTTADGATVGYGTLLLATGSSPHRLGARQDARVAYLRSVADYRHLRDLVQEGTRTAVVGGGYIGSEIAAGLSAAGAEVTLFHSGDRLLGGMFPESVSTHVAEVFAEKGIRLTGGFRLAGIDAGEHLTLTAEDGRSETADVAVLGLGAQLETSLAREAGLELDGDFVVVDEQLRTSAPDVWAAGDIIRFTDPLLGDRHVEHIDHAEASGEAAGRNMVGGQEKYEYTPLFYSDLFDDGYEAVGRLDASLETVETWDADHGAAVVHYLEGSEVVGVLLWNTWDAVPTAREVIAASQAGRLSPDELAQQITPGG